jgi:chromosome segregation protein
MRLTKIKLAGFKSFVDPTTIHFPGNLMGIVGPNGCGKSNIIDAIRWVLGESSAKTLRGDSMVDVIFNGSGTRKPVGQASIELTFDNSDGKVGGAYAEYSEIAVRRVVTRDGTSQYFLNNGRCRRKDITHILLGTGVGSHGYSIIEQGMISRLVEAKPEELRGFLEEAAGISKYKERRRETENRIRHTRDNLERLADLREEVEKQLTHLQRQAKAATRYKELKAEQRRVHAELLALRMKSLSAEVTEHEARFRERQTALEGAIAQQRAVEAEIERLRAELAERNDSFNEVQGGYYRVGAEIARLEQAIQHRKELAQRHGDDLKATDEQLAEIQQHIESDRVKLQQLELVLSELSPELDQAHSSRAASERSLAEAEESMERWRERWEGTARDVAEADSAIEVEQARLEQINAQRERLEREQQKLSEERGQLSTAELEQRLETLISQEESLAAACRDAAQAVESASRQIQQLREEEKKVSDHLDQLRGRLQTDRGRLTSLEALQEAALGNSSGKSARELHKWLDTRGLSERPRLGQLLQVSAGWERAVETVLGANLQAIQVDDINALAGQLTELGEGGLTLLEAPSGHGAGTSNASDRPTAAEAAELTPLMDFISSPAEVAPLLHGVFAAETLSQAVGMRSRLRDGQSVVTRDGYWLGESWLRVSRSDDPQVGVIARADEIKQLRAATTETAKRVDEVSRALASTRSRLEQLEETRTRAQSESGRRQQLYAEARTALQTGRSELDRTRQRAGTVDRALSELKTEGERLKSALSEAEQRLARARSDNSRLAEERERLESERLQHQTRLSEARARAEHDRQQAQEIAIQVESRRSSKESADAALARVQTQQQQLTRRREELQRQIESARAPLQEEESALAARLDERLGVERQLNDARTAMEASDSMLREVQARRSETEQAVNEAREGVDTERLAVREAQVRAESVAEQLGETGFALEALLAELPEDASEEAWHESYERTERRIQRLGPINLAAIDEFEEQSKRKEYLDAQFKDLNDALETLENAIRKIDRETRTRFKETFDKANQGLGRLFPRLFGGGHAYLELDGDDLLSSGVSIMARPPGKRISTIHLMSGGEKALTAVALVFSIFELNPAPFCLLDEVDAPLDDANVGRFSEIVKEMSQQVQFILITHNKVTMESMQQLTGVTMNEPGVSRLVAVDIDEAVKLAAV